MWKKAAALTIALALAISPAAFAADDLSADTVGTLPAALRQPAQLLAKQLRPAAASGPGLKARMQEEWFGGRLHELEELQASDPEALKAKLLERHDQLVAEAQKVVDNQANLAQQIIDRAVAEQTKAVERATEAAASAKDADLAAKRLAFVKARQELLVAEAKQHAPEIAARMLERAQQVLDNAAGIRSRIENGEGLQVVKEQLQQQRELAKQRRQCPIGLGGK